MTLLQTFNANLSKSVEHTKDLTPGTIVRVHQKIVETGEKGKKERTQIFEGIIIARRSKEPSLCTITVRKISNGVGVERIFPVISPSVEKIEVVRKMRVRRAKLFYLRDLRGKASKLKEMILSEKELKELAQKQAEEKQIEQSKIEKSRQQTDKEQGNVVASAETTPQASEQSSQ